MISEELIGVLEDAICSVSRSVLRVPCPWFWADPYGFRP